MFLINYFFAILSILYLSVDCSDSKTKLSHVDSKINAYEFEYELPIEIEGFNGGKNPNTFRIYYYDSLIMYRFPYVYDSVVNNKSIKQEFRYRYFIFSITDRYGALIDVMKPNYKRILKVDSLLKKKAFLPLNELSEKIDKEIFLLRSELDSTGMKMKETYYTKKKNTIFDPDSVYFYYDKGLIKAKYSMIRKLDTLKMSKLYQIRMVSRDNKSPEREMFFKFKEIPIPDADLLETLFKNYKTIR